MIRSWKDWHGVVALLVLLFGITYLDRVCISVAGPRMQEDLHIGPIGWGWVTGVFTISYCLFEIPTGILGDRIGPRRVLTRIVVWWSAFTALTGAVTSYYPLLVTRFLFGAGEAGAFPNAAVVISRWFPPSRRATMCGVTLMARQIGGALAPLWFGLMNTASQIGGLVGSVAFGYIVEHFGNYDAPFVPMAKAYSFLSALLRASQALRAEPQGAPVLLST